MDGDTYFSECDFRFSSFQNSVFNETIFEKCNFSNVSVDTKTRFEFCYFGKNTKGTRLFTKGAAKFEMCFIHSSVAKRILEKGIMIPKSLTVVDNSANIKAVLDSFIS